MIQSLWKIPDVANARTPLSILTEQAALLGEETDGALVGVTNVQPASSDMSLLSLLIRVPALNNYHYQILTFTQPITLFPGRLTPAFQGSTSYIVTDEQEFVERLGDVLASDQTRKILGSLLAQALTKS